MYLSPETVTCDAGSTGGFLGCVWNECCHLENEEEERRERGEKDLKRKEGRERG